MKLHHLDCGGARPLGARLFPHRYQKVMVCHVIAIDTGAGLVLIDTGLSADELRRPSSLGPVGRGLGIHGEPERAAIEQLRRLGYSASDVTHVVMTHLDLDHAGGLRDFPDATVHLSEPEFTAAMQRRSIGERLRYRPAQWSHGPEWRTYAVAPGTESSRIALAGLPLDIALVPLFGHTRGHCGVAFRVDGVDYLHLGDTWYAIDEEAPGPSLAYTLFQSSIHVHRKRANESRRRMEAYLADVPEVVAYTSHDPRCMR